MAALTITPANVLASTGALRGSGIAGETIAQGEVVYKDATDSGKIKLADANVSAAAATVRGIAECAASAGQPIFYATEDAAFTPGATLEVGEVYVLGNTPGELVPVADLTTGDYSSTVLVASSTSQGILKISNSGGQVS